MIPESVLRERENNRIQEKKKPKIMETVEEFLQRGGVIQQIPKMKAFNKLNNISGPTNDYMPYRKGYKQKDSTTPEFDKTPRCSRCKKTVTEVRLNKMSDKDTHPILWVCDKCLAN